MKQSSRILAFAVATLALAATMASAAPEPLALDVSHTSVGFQVRHFFSKVPGRFKEFSGNIQYDAKNVTASSVNVEIKTASINTENERRDNHLRSGDFFLADSFPTMTFKSTKVVSSKPSLSEGDKFQILGDLTIRGVTKPVTLEATYLGGGPLAMGGNAMGNVLGFEATGTVNRKDYGIVWNRALDQGGTMLGDDVTLVLAVEAKTPPAPKPAEKK